MNKKSLTTLATILGILAIIIIWLIAGYNSLVTADEKVQTSWSQVETVYQRRFDLIPNLVATVKGAAQQEKAVFGEIAKARQGYAGANTVDEKVEAAGEYEGALSRLLVIMENYPELKSIQSFNDLMIQIEGTENRISTERQRYNKTVEIFNIKVKRIPGALFANLFGFEPYTRFESVEAAAEAPKVQF